MKRYGNLYAKICSKENLKLAYKHAKKGKGWYAEVKTIEANLDYYIDELHEMLVNHQFHTSNYVTFTKKEGKGVKHYYRYMDDICVFSDSKETLHRLLSEMNQYLMDNLNLRIKGELPDFPFFHPWR